MASGHKTGGRQKGTPNKAKAQLDARLAEAAERATASLTSEQIAMMTPLDVMTHAMKLEVASAQWRVAASLAEKVAPYFHAKMAPRAEDGGGDNEVTIRITGGLPDE